MRPAILVESYEDDESVSHHVDDLEGQKRIKSALAHTGTRVLLKMLLVDNFIHAYMHPGNVFVWVAHVIFLYVGMTVGFSKSDQVNLLGFFKVVARSDGRTLNHTQII